LIVEETLGSFVEMIREPWRQGDEVLPYIGLEHIGEATLAVASLSTTSGVTGDQIRFQKGDVLFGKLRPYFRKVVQVQCEGACTPEIWVLRPSDERCAPDYLRWIVSSRRFVDHANHATGGTRMPRANWTWCSSFRVRLPDTDEQAVISSVLTSLSNSFLAALAGGHLPEAETIIALRDHLIDALVDGRRRVRVESADMAATDLLASA
jgi:type I restriction enzyme S subunit